MSKSLSFRDAVVATATPAVLSAVRKRDDLTCCNVRFPPKAAISSVSAFDPFLRLPLTSRWQRWRVHGDGSY